MRSLSHQKEVCLLRDMVVCPTTNWFTALGHSRELSPLDETLADVTVTVYRRSAKAFGSSCTSQTADGGAITGGYTSACRTPA
jgi:hypothetical protein